VVFPSLEGDQSPWQNWMGAHGRIGPLDPPLYVTVQSVAVGLLNVTEPSSRWYEVSPY